MTKRDNSSEESEEEYIIFPNADKQHLKERWFKRRHYLNFPYPFKILQIAPTSSGKSNMLKNIIFRSQPEYGSPMYTRIVVWCKSKSVEWDPDEFELIYDAPEDYENFFDRVNDKNMLIIEDIILESPNPHVKEALDYYFRHESSRGLSIAVNVQDFTQSPPSLRRQCEIINIFGSIPCKQTIKLLAKRSGLKDSVFQETLNLLNPPFDCLTLDKTKNSPYPIRYFDGSKKRMYNVKIEDDRIVLMKLGKK